MTTTGACLAALLFVGCSAESQQWIISTFFDDADTPPPPTHRVRRDFLREIEELKRKLAEADQKLAAGQEAGKAGKGPGGGTAAPIEQAKSWQEATKFLPKDKAGNIDWGQALKSGAIAPRPGIDPKAPAQAPLELDIELPSSVNKMYSATFSHAGHTQWLTCGNCHPAIFLLGRGAPRPAITMAKLQAGQYCGACHGRVAFGVMGDCIQCHKGISAPPERKPTGKPRKPIEQATSWEEAAKLLPAKGGIPDWTKALADGVIAPRPGIDPKAEDQPALPMTVEREPAGQPAMKAIFPHEVHTQWLICDNCHPAIFQMQKGATKINMELISAGQSCGLCHGSVVFGATACDRCHPAMAGGK